MTTMGVVVGIVVDVGGVFVRFCLKHFGDVTIFIVNNFVILNKIKLN